MTTMSLVITSVATIWVSGEVAAAQTSTPAVVYAEQVAVSQPLSQGTDHTTNNNGKTKRLHPIPHKGNGPNRDDEGVLQSSAGGRRKTNDGIQFPGVGSNGFVPPDTNMAVGPNHILQTVNSRYAIFDKSGNLLVGPFSLSSIWAPLGSGNGCATNDAGDVVAQYDKLADRFVVTQLGGIEPPYSECIAVSQTSDPAGAYWLYSYGYGDTINDYPKFGVWPTATNSAYLATYNLFADPQTFTGGQLCAYDRIKMLSGDPSAQGICYTIDNDGGYLPADLDGSNPPLDGTPGYFLNYETTSSLRMYALSTNFANPGASTLSQVGSDIPVASFSEACAPAGTCIPQPGTSQRLDSVGDRLMYRPAFRNFGTHEAIVVNHSVATSSRVGVRWYELRAPVSTSGTFSLHQQGTYSPDSTYRWMGSAAMDQSGNMAIGYSASSGTVRPSIRYAARLAGDPLGTLQPEVNMVTGTGSQTGGISRWGDYTALRIDPVDDCTFWYTNEYLISNGGFNWQTAFGAFKFAECNPANFTMSVSPSSVTVSQGGATNTALTVTALSGFSGAVGLNISGCPANTTCTLPTSVIPNPTATPVLDVVTTSNTSVGTYTMTIIGTNAGSFVSTTVSLTVNPPPDFSISANPSPLTVLQVGTGTSTITVTSLYGFTGNVDLSLTGCPSGATCSLPTPVSLGSTAASTLAVSLSTNTASGIYPLTITGVHGTLIHTMTLSLNVLPAGTPTNVALPANGGSVVASSVFGGSTAATNAIDGDRKGLAYWNDGTSNSFPDWLEVDFNGTKPVREIDVFSAQDNFQSPVDPTPTMTFSSYGLRNFEVQYWTGSTWTDVPGGTVTNNNLVWRQFTFTPLTTSKIRVLVTATADGLWSRIAEVEAYANVSTNPDFSISASPSSLTLIPGGGATSTVTVTALNGFSGNINLALTGCPAGVTCSLPTSVTPTATTTLTVSTSTSAGTGTFTLTITGTHDAVIHTSTVSLTINPPGTLTNVALPANGGAVVASSVFGSSTAATNAIDADRKGLAYWNDGTSSSFPDWLEVDFNGTKPVSEIDVFSAQDNYQSPINPTPTTTFTLYGLRNFEVQFFNGSAWAPIPGGTVTNNNLVWRKFTFAPLATSKIRVLVTATADGVWSRIAEVEAYAMVTSSPDFLISANPSSLTLVQVGVGNSTVTATAFNGLSGNVDLAVTGCPSGATCSLPTPVSLSPTAASTLTISLSTSAGTGTFPLTITATQGVLIRTTTVTMTILPAGTLTNVALPANGGSVVASSVFGSSTAATNAIDGDRKGLAYWNDGTSSSFPDWLEVDFNGTKPVSEIDVFSAQDNFQSPVDPTPTMTFSSYGLRNFEVQYWTGSTWTDVPGGTVTNNNLVWRQFTFTPLTTSKIRVLVTATADGVWSRIAEVEAYANPSSNPDFTIVADPSALTFTQGGNGNSTVTLTALNGFTGNVDLAVTGCPSGVTCSLPTPVSSTSTSTLTISASASSSLGTFPLTITGTQNAVMHTATVSFTVNSSIILTNVALPVNGGSAVASSVFGSTTAAAKAIDGDRKGLAYWNDGTQNSFPDWLEVDFNGTKSVSEIDVFSVQDNFQSPANPTPTMTFGLYGLRNFEVQYWTGSAWTAVPGGTITNNNLVWRQLTFVPLSTSKIRVLVTATADGVWSRIAEVEAYANVNPDFSISASPSSLTLMPGGGATSTVTVTALNGFSGNINLALTGCPAGVTCSLPTSVTPTATTTLTVSTSTSAGTGTFTLTITGTHNAVIHTSTVSLTINPPGTLTNVALPANGGAVVASSVFGSSTAATKAIDGDRKGLAYWNDGTSSSFPDWLEVDFNGTKPVSEIDVFSVQDNFQSPVNPTPTMTFSLYGLRNFEVQYWTGSAWTDVPGGAVTNNNLVWRQFTFATLATSKIRVLVTGTADGVWSRIAEVEAYVSSSPDFVVSANPSSMTVAQGGNGNSTVTVTSLNGFSGSVDLAVTGCPAGATCSLVPATISPTATSTLTVSTSASAGTGTFTLTITGSQGAVMRTATVSFAINPAGANVALPVNGGVAVASSVFGSTTAAAKAIDGDRKGLAYWNDGTQNSFPDWLEVDFNGTKSVSEIDVFSVQDNFQSPVNPTPTMTFSLYGLRNFEVQYWTGSAWTNVPGGAVTNNSLVWRQFTFAPVTTTKIRVLVAATADGVWSRIAEVEAYAVP